MRRKNGTGLEMPAREKTQATYAQVLAPPKRCLGMRPTCSWLKKRDVRQSTTTGFWLKQKAGCGQSTFCGALGRPMAQSFCLISISSHKLILARFAKCRNPRTNPDSPSVFGRVAPAQNCRKHPIKPPNVAQSTSPGGAAEQCRAR